MEFAHDSGARRLEDEISSPRKILRACLLLLLEERPGHGYDLLTRLEPLGFERSNPGRVYRALRWLENAGFVQPNWETTGVGPARRVYELSAAGRQALELAAPALRRQAKTMEDALARYVLARLRVLAHHKQTFEFKVQAELSVQAMDETSARRKLERTFGPGHTFGTDVRALGELSITAAPSH